MQVDAFHADDTVATSEGCGGIRSGREPLSRCNERGQSLIEFTLVMPLLLLIVTGMLSFGLAMHDFLALTNGVNIGAQLLSISRGQTADPCATAYGAIHNAGPTLNTSKLSLTFVINGTTYSAVTSCAAGAANMVQGVSAQVMATYPCTLAIFSLDFPSCQLAAQTTEIIQ